MNIVLMGPPASGKGTQTDFIIENYGLAHVSPGNFLRDEVKKATPFGKKIKHIIEAGNIVDPKLVMELIESRVKQKNNILFDGVPRTIGQAKELDRFYHVDIVIYITTSDKEVIKRITKRWLVELNGEQHSFVGREKAQKYVDENGGKLFQRKDDSPDVVKHRLDVFHSQTEPLLEYYGRQHKLYTVNGERSINQVWHQINLLLKKLQTKKEKELHSRLYGHHQ